FGVFMLIALLCGFAGANFASSMGNISFFFPKARQGSALGINGNNLDPEMLNKPFDPNNDYSVPYIWGATAIGVNSDAIDPKTIT
ncbi:hypothetical protein MJI47_27650, partial [Salmonella enterica subsp. enterica serovar Kentucky]|nr:hypothetical protein [Salmonella enterica subsp. enterica serovar Kentucky]